MAVAPRSHMYARSGLQTHPLFLQLSLRICLQQIKGRSSESVQGNFTEVQMLDLHRHGALQRQCPYRCPAWVQVCCKCAALCTRAIHLVLT